MERIMMVKVKCLLNVVVVCLVVVCTASNVQALAAISSESANSRNPLNGISCFSDRLAVYKVVLHTYWTRELFPKHYPDWRPPAQWTKTIGRSHDDKFSLFRVGEEASAALKQFVETSRSDLLIDARQPAVFDEFILPPITAGAGRSEARFFVDGNHSVVSLVTRIVPSPDWFVGIDSFKLCAGGTWIDSMTVELDPLDAGTDNGFTFTAPNWPTEPQGVIYRITSSYPAHPASSFYYPENKRLPPIATYQFIKLKEYELSEVFNHSEDERRYETLATSTRLKSEHNQVEMNNELSANIEMERQHEMTPTPKVFTQKDRIRAKLLARLNPNNNKTTSSYGLYSLLPTAQTTIPPPGSMTAVPKNDKEALLSNIVSNYKTMASRGRLGTGKRLRKVRPPRDCRVGDWSEWSSCSKSCGIGEMHRFRKVVRHSKRGGRPCPPLQESKWCGSARDCNPSYFKW